MADDRKACPPELRAQYFKDPQGTRFTTQQDLVLRALRDPHLREELKRDARGVIARELGLTIPSGVKVNILEEDANTVYLVLPFTSPMGAAPSAAASKESLAAASSTGATCTQFGSCC